MRYYPAPPPTSLDPAAIQRYLSDELRKIGQLIFDVEAGAWTAAIRGSGTAGTYQISSQTCRYTRIGRRVFIDVGIVMAGTVTGGGTGYLQITGLPFPKAANTSAFGTVLGVGLDMTTAGAFLTLAFISTAETSTLYLRETSDNISGTDFQIAGLGVNDQIFGSITYETDAP